MPIYDPRFWDWYTDDNGNLRVERWEDNRRGRVFSRRDWMWARTKLGSMRVVRRRCRPPHERCPVCLRKLHFEEMVEAVTGDRVCFRCDGNPRLLRLAGRPV